MIFIKSEFLIMDEKNKKLIGELNQWVREKQDKSDDRKGGYMFYLGLGTIFLLTYGGALASYYLSDAKPANRVVIQQSIPGIEPAEQVPKFSYKGENKKKPPRVIEHRRDEYGEYTYEDSDY